MSEIVEQSIVALLEERVELAISTVQQLRAEKSELEAEIARLSSDVVARDTRIQELESQNSDLDAELELERLASSEERSEIRDRLAGLMDVLVASDGGETAAEAESTVSDEAIGFQVQAEPASESETSEEEVSAERKVFGSL